ncbi:VIT domain-containing protein [Lysobacter sp. Root983]|uniref:VIT domain-containing protein n=1 Tax=Lysobacter sp. Root983 TaxID=1736613 RepID=UPI000A888AAE|nr:VIT domain-containing protein [Lysobacter sp. Root983]
MRSYVLHVCLLLGLSGAVAAQVIGPPDRGSVTAPPLMRAPGAERPIVLETATVEVELNGGLAQTTVELTFRNPNARPLEGELQFPLHEGQQISAFALDIDGRMRAAVPVPKAQGQAVFESIERRGVDPALLEKTEGNHFRLRVYPIPAQGTRRVRLSYVEALRPDRDGRRLRLPLDYARGADAVDLRVIARGASAPRVDSGFGRVDFKRDGQGGYRARIERAQLVGGGLGLRFARAESAQVYTQSVDGQHYFLAEVPVAASVAQRALPQRVGLVWDSSASGRKRDLAGELALLDRYFAALGDAQVRLIRLRDRAEDAGDFRVQGGDWRALRDALKATVYDGATDPGGWTPQAEVEEYLLVSDGLFNYGQRRFPELGRGQRLYAINSAGNAADSARLSALAEGHGGRLIAWQTPGAIESGARELLAADARLADLEALGATDLVAESAYPQDGVLRVAGRLTAPSATLTLGFAGQSPQQLTIGADAPDSAYAARLWAGYRVRALGAEPELNRAAIARLSQQFGLVTPESSLLVLEAVADYLQYDILPPVELRAEFDRLKSAQRGQRDEARRSHLDAIAAQFEDTVQWWQKTWPKGRPPQPKPTIAAPTTESDSYAYAPPMPMAAPAPSAVREVAAADAASQSLERIEVTGARISAEDLEPEAAPKGEAGDGGEGRGATIALQAWKPDSPYAARLRKAGPEQAYAIYLDERDGYAASTAFYLDVADVLLEKKQRALALRVLSNLAELDLENRHILRVLGYRLLQADEPTLAVPLFERVVRLAEEEPQSFRDLGLAHAAARDYQPAIDSLYQVVSRTWDSRFDGVALIALNELNAIVATSGRPLDTSAMDKRLLRNLPLDLRAVLSWDSDNSDMDLWVTDPNGERCYYQHTLTYQGGRISKDFTGGYGPEEFMLRDAKPGKYKVEANFYGDRQQLVTGATTLQLWLSTGFGTARQQDQRVTLRLKQQSETVLVGEFEVK